MSLIDKDERDGYLRRNKNISNQEFVKEFLPPKNSEVKKKSRVYIFDNIYFSIYKNRCFGPGGKAVPKNDARKILEEDSINNPSNTRDGSLYRLRYENGMKN